MCEDQQFALNVLILSANMIETVRAAALIYSNTVVLPSSVPLLHICLSCVNSK
jgi:hypothetical protein